MSALPSLPADVNYERSEMVAIGFLARYREPTRTLYRSNLKQWFDWCGRHGMEPLTASRAHIEVYARELEELRGLKASTVCNKLNTIAGFYRFATIDKYIVDNPAEYLRKPSVKRQSTTNALTRTELLKVLDVAQETGRQDHALLCILGLNGLRIGEACALNVDDLGRAGGYRTVNIRREKGNRDGIIPLSPRASWAVDGIVIDRTEGPLFRMRYGARMDRKAANRIVQRNLRKAEIVGKRITPHSFRHTFVTLALNAGCHVRDVQNSLGYSDSRMVAYYDRDRDSLPRHATHMVSAWVEGS